MAIKENSKFLLKIFKVLNDFERMHDFLQTYRSYGPQIFNEDIQLTLVDCIRSVFENTNWFSIFIFFVDGHFL